jgi:hypothetical protein
VVEEEEIQSDHFAKEAIVRRVVFVLALMGVFFGSGQAAARSAADGSGLQSLERQDSRFDDTLVRPDADLSLYADVQPSEVELEYRKDERGATRSATGNILGSKSNSLPRPSRREAVKFKEIVEEAVAAELTEAPILPPSDHDGDRTLLVNCTYTDMVFTAPKKPRKGDPPMQLVADGTLVFDLVDSETGEIQARLSERRRIVHINGEDDRGGKPDVWLDVENWARQAAEDLRDELQRLGSAGNS